MAPAGAAQGPGPALGQPHPDPPGMLELVISRLADGPVPGAGMPGAIRSKRPAICSFPCSNRAAAAGPPRPGSSPRRRCSAPARRPPATPRPGGRPARWPGSRPDRDATEHRRGTPRRAPRPPRPRRGFPGPQLPAHTARSPVSAASAAAANPAASSCRTCSQVISPSRRSASVNPFSESPGSPYTRRTPDALSVETMTSATVAVILWSFRLCHVPCDQRVPA